MKKSGSQEKMMLKKIDRSEVHLKYRRWKES